MKKCLQKMLSLLLCLSLCLGTALPAFAVGESNDKGITFDAALDTNTLIVSDVAQEVKMTIKATPGATFDGMGMTLTWSDGLTLSSVAGGTAVEANNPFTTAMYNTTNGVVTWGTNDMEVISNVTDMLVATFVVPANTPAGTYTLGAEGIELTDDYAGNTWENSASVSATLTVSDATPATDVTLAKNASIGTVYKGDIIKVDIGANKVYSATEMIISYDSAYVTLAESGHALGTATINDYVPENVDATSTVKYLKLADYGTEKKSDGTANYTLAFTANADGDAVFAITEAGLGTGISAETASLTPASVPSALTVTIVKKQFNVTLPEIYVSTSGANTVEEGSSFTFKPETTTGEFYTYDTPTATLEGGTTLAVTANADGSWTVAGVTGNLTISGNRTANTYDVTTTYVDDKGEQLSTKTEENKATYDTKYEFTVDADVPATTTEGYTYTLKSVTINNANFTDYDVETDTKNYSIPGADVTGDIVITIEKKTLPANTFPVGITGSAAGSVKADPEQVESGKNVTLTFTPEAGYEYTFKIGGKEVALSEWTPSEDGKTYTYTIQNVQSTADVTVVVNKTLSTANASVSEYIKLDGKSVWLVKIAPDAEGTKLEAKTYTCNENDMYWSENYKAYCYLIIAPEKPVITSVDTSVEVLKFDQKTVTEIPTITYNLNVNMTEDGKVDANDAQLVYNMYQTGYDKFTTNVPMMKFFKADTNNTGTVDSTDAVKIINSILGITETA